MKELVDLLVLMPDFVGSSMLPSDLDDSDLRFATEDKAELCSSPPSRFGGEEMDGSLEGSWKVTVCLLAEAPASFCSCMLFLLSFLVPNESLILEVESFSSLWISADRRIRMGIFIRFFLGEKLRSTVGAVMIMEGAGWA